MNAQVNTVNAQGEVGLNYVGNGDDSKRNLAMNFGENRFETIDE